MLTERTSPGKAAGRKKGSLLLPQIYHSKEDKTDETAARCQDATFFTRKEILRLFDKYRELAPHRVPQDYTRKPSVKPACRSSRKAEFSVP